MLAEQKYLLNEGVFKEQSLGLSDVRHNCRKIIEACKANPSICDAINQGLFDLLQNVSEGKSSKGKKLNEDSKGNFKGGNTKKIKKRGNKWIILGKDGKPWDAEYDTKEDALAGLRAYHANK